MPRVVALVDRLINRADIVAINGDSYRLHEAEERQKVKASSAEDAQGPPAKVIALFELGR